MRNAGWARTTVLPVVLFAALLTGCQFQPGMLRVVDDANGGGDDTNGQDEDAAVDTVTAIDAVSDAASLIHTRVIDLVDAQIAGGPHADFPLLVSLSATWLRTTAFGGEVANTSGYDIHFSADALGAVPLAHEIERYTPDAGVLVAWVKVPALSSTTVLYIHDGDPSITTSLELPSAVWSNGFELVLHLDDLVDSTGKATATATAVAAASGMVDGGQSFNGATSIGDLGSAAAVDNVFAGGGTVEAWFYADTVGENSYGRLFDKGHPNGWTFMINDVEYTNALTFYHASSGGTGAWATPSNSITLAAWHHAVAVYDKDVVSNAPTVYIDGAVQTLSRYLTPSGTVSSDASYTLYLGNRGTGDRTFDGTLDEGRLSSVARSADWVVTTYRNQADPAGFYTVTLASTP